jgi:hypothetical protein
MLIKMRISLMVLLPKSDRGEHMGSTRHLRAGSPYDLGHDLTKRDGGPVQVIRIDPRDKGAKR